MRLHPMRFYAERPSRVARQVLGDGLVVGWLVLVWLAAVAARELILALQGPGRALMNAGSSVRGAFDDAASVAAGVPLVGGDLATALGSGSSAGSSLVRSGADQIEVVASVASGTAVGIVTLGALPVLLVWVPLRVRYARAATSARAVRGRDDDLLALRAMTRLPVRRLLQVCPDPAAAWRRPDPAAVRRLAALELDALGLRPPATPPTEQVSPRP